MQKIFLIICLLARVTIAAELSPASEAFVAIRAGDPKLAMEKLATIPHESPEFTWAMLEGARLQYREKKWQEFFGIASFGRMQETVDLNLEKLRLLEILALLRHCQFELAKPLVVDAIPRASKKNRDQFLVLADLLDVAPTSWETKAAASGKLDGRKKAERLWPIAKDALKSLSPFKMRRKIEPLCQIEVKAE